MNETEKLLISSIKEVARLRRELHDERVRRDEWKKMYDQAIAGTEAERLRVHLASERRLQERLTTLADAEAALADCGIGGIFAEFDGLPDAIEQMAQHIKELASRLTQAQADLGAEPIEVEITGREIVKALQEERRLRQEAEKRADLLQQECDRWRDDWENATAELLNAQERQAQAKRHAKNLCSAMVKIHKALDECKVRATYEDDTHHLAIARHRIFWLNERAERAEAIAKPDPDTQSCRDECEGCDNHGSAAWVGNDPTSGNDLCGACQGYDVKETRDALEAKMNAAAEADAMEETAGVEEALDEKWSPARSKQWWRNQA